eukprot:TRINITY_DN569_c0_g1_i5.p1 TRINITY_DN569_c0_g1~~TRINITY_DN569_c0_g1_i5.p1  ORF type:complete len:121 (-),score=14.82 TRINITY_DN569_c0_g1_i5:277-639(-)
MPKSYSKKVSNEATAVYAKGSNLRVHFKNTRETAHAIRGLTLFKAQKYLKDVIKRKNCVPFRRFNGGVGRSTHAKMHPNTTGQGRYPVKSCEFLQNLLKNAESNAIVFFSTFGPILRFDR